MTCHGNNIIWFIVSTWEIGRILTTILINSLYIPWKTRFSLDNLIKIICWVLHTRLGQSSKDSPSLLHKLCIISRGLFPDSHLQHPWLELQEHHCQPWPSLHFLGHTSKAASKIPRAKGFQKNGTQQPAIC